MKALLLVLAVMLVGCASGPKENTASPTPPIAKPTAPTSTSWTSVPSDPNNVKIEAAIRKAAKKPTGKLTEADLEKVTMLFLVSKKLTEGPKGLGKLTQLKFLNLDGNKLTEVPKGLEKLTQLTSLNLLNNKLTDVKGLEKLTQLEMLYLQANAALTRTQIAELQKALPKCVIAHRYAK